MDEELMDTSEKPSRDEFSNPTSQSDLTLRPHNLSDFAKKEALLQDTESKSTFALNELDEDEDEIWVLEIPKTVDPVLLKGKTIHLGDKTKFKVGHDRYYAHNRDSHSSITCVFNAESKSKDYQTVNIKPAGTLHMRRKITDSQLITPIVEECNKVPYPQNLKIRDPFLEIKFEKLEIEKFTNNFCRDV